jgi:hypothetical protein
MKHDAFPAEQESKTPIPNRRRSEASSRNLHRIGSSSGRVEVYRNVFGSRPTKAQAFRCE